MLTGTRSAVKTQERKQKVENAVDKGYLLGVANAVGLNGRKCVS